MIHQGVIVWLLIGCVAGWLAGLVVKGGGFGLIGNVVVGVLGSLVGGWLFPHFGVQIGSGVIREIAHAAIGAIAMLIALSLLRRILS